MSQKKGIVPKHIQAKTFQHPGEHSPWVQVLQRVEDPRKPSCNTRYSVTSILFIVFVTTLCGAKNWEEMQELAQGEDFAKWLGRYVDLSEGVPSKWTLERVTSLIPTSQLQPLLAQFKSTIIKKADTVAIDGKTLRGTRNWEGKAALHLLHAWSVEERICLAQIPVEEKSNEITAFPELIALLELRGAIVTADALNTQKKSVEAIVQKQADYVLPVKNNHPDLLEDIELLFKEADQLKFCGIDAAQTETLKKVGGRVEKHQYALLSAEQLPSIEKWKKCCCVGRVIRERNKKDKNTQETVYYITSLDFDVEQFAKSVRGHWDIENGLHWSLDVIFSEDKHRYQQKTGAANLSLMRKIALEILTKDTTVKKGRATKQMRAMGSPTYRTHLLKNCF